MSIGAMLELQYAKVRHTAQLVVQEFGVDAQLGMVQEECAELITKINHLNRGRCSAEDLLAEAADVQVMLWQLRAMFPDVNYAAMLDEKHAHLLSLLEKQTPMHQLEEE